MNQLTLYLLISNVSMAGCVYHALDTRTSYLSAGIFLSGGLNVIIISNWVLSWLILITRVIQSVLFGRLRLIEIEHIQERFLPALIAYIFSFTYLKGNNSFILGYLVIITVMLNLCHWVLFDRLDSLFQVNDENQLRDLNRFVFNRTIFAALVMSFIDYKFLTYCLKSYNYTHKELYAIFGFEVGFLLLENLFHICKEAINIAEVIYVKRNESEEVLENKGLYIRALELVFCVSKLCIYTCLIAIFYENYPVHFVRGFFYGIFDLYKKAKEFIPFIRNAKKLDKFLDNATEEDLEGSDSLCIICREDMSTEGVTPGSRLFPKKLKCGHIIHLGCLKSWIEVSENCPTCRAKVFSTESIQSSRTRTALINNENSTENNASIESETYFEDRRDISEVSHNENLSVATGWTVLPIEGTPNNLEISLENGEKATIQIRDNEKGSYNAKRKHKKNRDNEKKIHEEAVTKLNDRLDSFEKKVDELYKKFDSYKLTSRSSGCEPNNELDEEYSE